jgi:hypothetical protein
VTMARRVRCFECCRLDDREIMVQQRDAANVLHWFHKSCLRAFVAWWKNTASATSRRRRGEGGSPDHRGRNLDGRP